MFVVAHRDEIGTWRVLRRNAGPSTLEWADWHNHPGVALPTAGLQQAQHSDPEGTDLAVADGEAEHPVGGHPGGDDHPWQTTRRFLRALQQGHR